MSALWARPTGPVSTVSTVSTESAARAEEGGATLLTVAALGVLTMVLGAALVVVAVVRDVHRARAAADLAALAAAQPLVRGGAPDCAAARAVAEANGAVLRACLVLPDRSVETWVARPRSGAGGWGIGLPDPSARARAGLVESRPP